MIGVFDDTILYQIKELLTSFFNRETLLLVLFEHILKKNWEMPIILNFIWTIWIEWSIWTIKSFSCAPVFVIGRW